MGIYESRREAVGVTKADERRGLLAEYILNDKADSAITTQNSSKNTTGCDYDKAGTRQGVITAKQDVITAKQEHDRV